MTKHDILGARGHAVGVAVSPAATPGIRSERYRYSIGAPPESAFHALPHFSSKGTQMNTLFF